MTSYYVRSGASGSANGTSWANAYTTMAAALSGKAAGDIFYVSDDHAETQTGTMTLTFPGTLANPNLVFCADHTGSVPPVSNDLRSSASISVTTSAANMQTAGCYYNYGVTFNCGTVGATPFNVTGITKAVFEHCDVVFGGSGGNFNTQISGSSLLDLVDTKIKFSGTSAQIVVKGKFRWRGNRSAVDPAGSIPTTLLNLTRNWNCEAILDGVDLSALGAGQTIVGPATGSDGRVVISNCKLGSGVAITTTPDTPGAVMVDVINCDSGGTNYRNERYRYEGTLTTETIIVRSGGASDGATPVSHKIVTSANSKWPQPFESFPLAIWNDTVGSAVTATVYGIWGGGAVPNNDDIWIEAEYLGSSSSPQGSLVSSGKVNGLASGSAAASDASSWGGSTTAFKMSVTFTPQQKGLIYITVKAAKASSTFYIDTKPEIPGVTVSKTYVAPGGVINELQSSGGGAAVARAGLHGIEQGIAA